jgi:hypothetical protein
LSAFFSPPALKTKTPPKVKSAFTLTSLFKEGPLLAPLSPFFKKPYGFLL